jgi:hypothetical protein
MMDGGTDTFDDFSANFIKIGVRSSSSFHLAMSASIALSIALCMYAIHSDAFIVSSNSNVRFHRSLAPHPRMRLYMDDEVRREGIKEELTTRDEYLETRFTKLSPSGHDLTPLTSEEVEAIIEQDSCGMVDAWMSDCSLEMMDDDMYLGKQQKGLYVCNVGGLPIFTSGSRVDEECSSTVLVFSEPCDTEHIRIEGNLVYCVRSGTLIGGVADNFTKYRAHVKNMKFLPLQSQLPTDSQPENAWGSEGQYRAWNSNEMISRPLTY